MKWPLPQVRAAHLRKIRQEDDMLAQNFKTPDDLGISDKEFDALFKVLGMLERGEIKHRAHGKTRPAPTGKFVGFNMAAFFGDTGCGTVACICGWAEHIGKLDGMLIDKRLVNKGLNALFEPNPHGGVQIAMDAIRADEAAIALRNFLTHGEPRWAEALIG
jgi:hypothetical protein